MVRELCQNRRGLLVTLFIRMGQIPHQHRRQRTNATSATGQR